MTDPDHWSLIAGGDLAALAQRQHRTDYLYRIAAWSGGTLTVSPAAADKWWPLTRKQP